MLCLRYVEVFITMFCNILWVKCTSVNSCTYWIFRKHGNKKSHVVEIKVQAALTLNRNCFSVQ